MEKPPDSKIAITPGTYGETVVTIPPAGFSAATFAVIAFLSLWLCGWAVGEGFAIFALIELLSGPMKGSGLPAAIFLCVWLTFWTFGGLMAFAQVYAGMRAMFGSERWTFEFGRIVREQELWCLRVRQAFDLNQSTSFALSPGPTPAQRLPHIGRLHFKSGKRTIYIAPSVTTEEQEWLTEAMNEIADRYRAA